MTTCSITEEASTHNPASITPTPDQNGADSSKKKSTTSNFNVESMTPSQTPSMENVDSQSSEENLGIFSCDNQSYCGKRKHEVDDMVDNRTSKKRMMISTDKWIAIQDDCRVGLGLNSGNVSPQVGCSQIICEYNANNIDFNFVGNVFSSGCHISRQGTPTRDFNEFGFGVSNPNSRCPTPMNTRGMSYHLPKYVGDLELNDLNQELTQQRNHDYAKEAFLLENRSSTYLIKHNMINKVMRWLVINWMHQVAHEHRLKRQTFHLAVNYFDLYLSKDANFPPDSLFQLLGATALIAASKVEEEEPPLSETLCEFMLDPDEPSMNAAILDDAKKKLFDLEFKMFKKLGWELSFHTAHDFLLSYFQLLRIRKPELPDEDVDLGSHIDIGNPDIILMCRIHVALFAKASNALADAVADYDCLKYSNSILASAIFYLSYESVLNEVFLENITGYNQNALSEAISFVLCYWNDASTDLSADYPDYGDMTVKYDYVHHQAQTYKTSEAMESCGEN